jgi:hypothetical protein
MRNTGAFEIQRTRARQSRRKAAGIDLSAGATSWQLLLPYKRTEVVIHLSLQIGLLTRRGRPENRSLVGRVYGIQCDKLKRVAR